MNNLGENLLPTDKSIAEEIVSIDGDECYLTEKDVWKLYTDIVYYLKGNNKLAAPSLELLVKVLNEMEILLNLADM